MRKVKWHKALGLMLTAALAFTSLPQGTMAARAEEAPQTVVQVSGGDAVTETVPVEESAEPEEVLLKFEDSAPEEMVLENFVSEDGTDGSILESTTLEVYNAAADLVITDIAGLIAFSESVANGNTYEGKNVKLGANITFDGITVNNFTPIGTENNGFNGIFDGGGFTISGLVIIENNKSDCCGLFREIGSSAVVKNLNLSNSEFVVTRELTEKRDMAGSLVGGIAGVCDGTLYNCTVNNVIISVNGNESYTYKVRHDYGYYYQDVYYTNTYYYCIGGLVGDVSGNIYNCKVTDAEISCEQESYNAYEGLIDGKSDLKDASAICVGGIAGYTDSVIDKCSVMNTYITGGEYCGGIAGYSGDSIKNCVSSASVKHGANFYAGGIAGQAVGGVTNCANLGVVELFQNELGNGTYAGGIVGYAEDTTIQNCYNVGNVSRSDSTLTCCGGLVGDAAGSTVVSACFYSNTASSDIYSSDSSVVTRNNSSMNLVDMKKTTFADRLNTNSAANTDWIPWEIRSGLDYPQHVEVYNISAEEISYGSLSVDKSYAYEGLPVNITVTPDAYYAVSSVSVKTTSGADVIVNGSGGSYSFTMPAEDVVVAVEFQYTKPITECSVTLGKTSYSYDGNAKEPSVTVKDGLKTLVSGTDYTISYSKNTNVGTGMVTVTGMGTYTGTQTVNFTITQASQGLSVTRGSYTKTYGDGTFSLGAKTKAGPEKITYSSSKESVVKVDKNGAVTIKGAGYATITVTATGNTNYEKETKKVTVLVKPQQQKNVSVKNVSGCGLEISWNKDFQADGYIVKYSKDGKNWSTKTCGSSATKTTITGLVLGEDYDVQVCSYVEANGTEYYGDYSAKKRSNKITASLKEKAISVTLSKTSYEFDNKAKTPAVTVTYGSKKLKAGKDYVLKYTNNKSVGTAKITITGKGNYTQAVEKTFKITKFTPVISVKSTYYYKTHGDKAFKLNAKLKKGEGYTTLSYKSSNKNVAAVDKKGKVTLKGPGKATITVTAAENKNCKKATKEITIYVYPKKAKITSIKGQKSGKISLKWSKVDKVSGYVVEYSRYSSFPSSYTYTDTYGSGKTSTTLKYLYSYDWYYVRVRAYKDTGNGRLYGDYSPVKSVRTK